jgi:hypothetical protein
MDFKIQPPAAAGGSDKTIRDSFYFPIFRISFSTSINGKARRFKSSHPIFFAADFLFGQQSCEKPIFEFTNN